MKRILLSLLCVAMLTPATSALAADKNTDGKQTNKIVMEARQSKMEFTAINVSRGVRLIIEDRNNGNIIIRAGKNVMPYIELSVVDGELSVKISDKLQNVSNLSADIYIPDNRRINKICATGLASVVVKPTLATTELDISATGASSVELNATVSGKAEIGCTGVSRVAASLTADECEVQVKGASTAVLAGTVREADIEVADASKLDASGLKCAEIDAEVAGASHLKARGTVCDIEASGASKAVVTCDGTLEAKAAGASTILYSGNCSLLKSSNIGASTIKKQ